MKTKKTLLPVEWTEAVIEDVPVTFASPLEVLAIRRLISFVRRSQDRATRPAANGCAVQVFAQIP
jgi:hypothetical protein